MLLLVLTGLFGLIIAYIIYTLLSSSGSDLADNSFEAFLINSPVTENPGNHKNGSKKPKLNFQPQYELPGRQILIIYSTEYGFSQTLSEELFDLISQRPDSGSGEPYPWQPRVVNAKNFSKVDLSLETVLLIIISTAGDGVPPTDGREFVKALQSTNPGSLSHLHYSVLALGDSNYVYYCRAGKTVDARLAELGGVCLTERRDVDSEDREKISDWFTAVLGSLDTLESPPRLDYLRPIEEEEEDDSLFTRDRPFMAALKVRYALTSTLGSSDDKETIHCEFDLADSGIAWTAGDALGIYPCNDLVEVESIIRSLGLSGQEAVPVPKWAYQYQHDDSLSISKALELFYDLKHVKPELLQLLLNHSTDASTSRNHLSELLTDGLFKSNTRLHDFLYERELRDVLEQFKDTATALLASNNNSSGGSSSGGSSSGGSSSGGLEKLLLEIRPLLPRYYSMSSSWIVDETTVCVTAAVVRYETLEVARSGVTTTYLQDRINVGQCCPVFISKNPDFRLPTDGNTPIIMIGPGTGIAPFRAFIQERLHCGAEGASVLYFGCRREKQDFLYSDQLNGWMKDGKLALRVAFSRDSPSHKIYVQHLLRQDAFAIWRMIKNGAHIYVCGDARNMAHDVHCALMHIVRTRGKGAPGKSVTGYVNEDQRAEKPVMNGNAVVVGHGDKNPHDVTTVLSAEKCSLSDKSSPDHDQELLVEMSGHGSTTNGNVNQSADRASQRDENRHEGNTVPDNGKLKTAEGIEDIISGGSNGKDLIGKRICQNQDVKILRNGNIKVLGNGSLYVDEEFDDEDVSCSTNEMTEEEAEVFLKNMEEEGRYQKDCWIT